MCACISDYRFIQFALASCYAVQIYALSLMKVYIERSNMQVELIRFRKKVSTLFTFTFANRGIQCNIAHRTQFCSCSVYYHSTDTIAGLTSTRCDCGNSIASLSLVPQSRYYLRIVNIMKVHIERNNLQLQLIRYSNFA